jgi:hypothetical protein
LLQCCIHIDRVPKSDDVDHEPQSSELIFLSLAVMLPQLASFAMEDGPREAMPILAAVKLRQDSPPFGLVINGCEEVNRFIDAADLGHGLCQPGRTVANLG